MATTFEVPLSPMPQRFLITLGDTEYQLTLTYRDAPEAGWILDIADVDGNTMIAGIPLVTGADLLEQYGYMGFAGALTVATDGDLDAVPTFHNLGTEAHLFFTVED